MTAVFYTGLTGKHLSVVQSLQTSVPEFADIGCFRDCPSTVLEMVRAILKKGLYPIARRRYQSVAGMLRDFEELSDRIEGKGITHWALWETGRERVRRTIQSNTAFHYICREEKLYPLRAATEAGEEVSLLDPAFFCKTDHTPVVLMGSGGMGKTTALLRMAYYQKKRILPWSRQLHIFRCLTGRTEGIRIFRTVFLKTCVLNHIRTAWRRRVMNCTDCCLLRSAQNRGSVRC